jgi:hypothetical protein
MTRPRLLVFALLVLVVVAVMGSWRAGVTLEPISAPEVLGHPR